jgi:hypothetical protein
VSVFSSGEAAVEVFGRLFGVLWEDDGFRSGIRRHGLTVCLVHTEPDCLVFVSGDRLVVGEDAPREAVVTVGMSCDTAHALWMGRLLVPVAVATGRVRIRGKVARVLELVPVLQPAFDRYPQIAAAAGIGV